MALNYNIQDIISCIEIMHPILADTVADTALDRLVELGSGADASACEWSNTPPRSCNAATIFKVIADTTDIGDLQWIQACASDVSAAIDEESTSSISDSSLSSDITSDSSSAFIDCDDYFILTPQRYETETSTLIIEMDVLTGNSQWEISSANGRVQMTILEIKATPSLPPIGLVSVDPLLDLIIYTPNPDGSDAGAVINIHVLVTETNNLCEVDMWIHLVVTEETTTA